MFPAARAARPTTVVLSSVFSDSHTWNVVFLELLLEEHGCQVVNLGACVPEDLLVQRCQDVRPDLVVISTVNGHGHLDGIRLARRLRTEPDLAVLPLVIGGKLGVGLTDGADPHCELINAGFDLVVEDSDPRRLLAYVDRLRGPALSCGRTS